MSPRFALLLALTLGLPALTACAPVIIGAGGAVVADEIMEEEKGGDGLF